MPTQERIEEKRRFPRINAAFPVKLKMERPYIDTMPSVSAETVDISRGGSSIALNFPLPFPSVANLQIDLSHGDSLMTEKVEVVWSTRFAGNKFQSGIRFLDMSDNHLNRIRQVMNELAASKEKNRVAEREEEGQLEI